MAAYKSYDVTMNKLFNTEQTNQIRERTEMNLIQLLHDTLKYCINRYQLPPITLRFGKHGAIREQSITIRAYWYQPEELAIAALLHQVAHVIQCTQHVYTHNKQFKDLERELLAEFGLCPIGYNQRASYYTTLQTISGGHRWDRGAARNRRDMIEGEFSILV